MFIVTYADVDFLAPLRSGIELSAEHFTPTGLAT